MVLFNKYSVATVASITTIVMGISTTPAEAAQFRYIFEGEGASGYFIYDDSTPNTPTNTPNLGEYFGAVTEYKIDLGQKAIYQGSKADNIVFLNRDGSGVPDPEQDEFILFVRNSDRKPESEYSISTRFIYPKDTLGSTDIPSIVPSIAELKVFPFVDFIGQNFGSSVFEGTVKTKIEKIPEPALLIGLLAFGANCIFRRQYHKIQPHMYRTKKQ
ncbi:MAG: hypothetical protein SAK29_36880 [Scytonema sp. PMC 1069.18]|nr:hypothetical protein [Scytonema sp. PMC 1069.18]MEC4883331.1 hypothetical protein [Scytonema sp. PMC 1070.18]